MQDRLSRFCPRALLAATFFLVASPALADPPAIVTRLDARAGDTLESLATKVFPRDASARRRYLEAMREANPAIASLGGNEAIPEGTDVALPDLRAFARSGASKPDVAVRRPAPGAGFFLKLSATEMDLTPMRDMDDRARDELRARLLVLSPDDEVAAMLGLRNRIAQLEAQMNELQFKLAQEPASFTASQPAASAAPPQFTRVSEPPKGRPPAAIPKPLPSIDYAALWKTYRVWGALLLALALFMLFIWRVSARRAAETEAEAPIIVA